MSLRPRHFLAPLAFALAALAASGADDAKVIYPAGSGAATAAAHKPESSVGPLTIFGAIILAGAGGWMLWRSRKLPFQARDVRKLSIDETRSLGSRQYLVVASYEGKKLLLGVCPGRIELLTSLDGRTSVAEKVS
ncbi:MAG: hypothetical protein JWM32_1550 [Verrucomicrobia bacterium]|nr:hypothetical protein [Verrucomicrobiota bacterium]